ncbi:hypothetical protein ACRAWB_17955 [Leifsonia poae]|uniref:hypothetical protein n=1 Tax=Leifsonia poae TaxID=110933 RepID=UPI003D69C8D3
MGVDPSADAADGWVRLGRPPWWTPIVFFPPTLLALILSDIVVVSGISRHPVPFLARVGIACAVGVLVLGATAVISRLLSPPTMANLADRELKAGRRVASFADITQAKLRAGTTRRRRSIAVELKTDHGFRATVVLRAPSGRLRTDREAAVLREVVERSSIRMPTSPDDPRGAFARYNFPDNLTKEDTLALIEKPPDVGDPLPIASRT